MVVAHSTVVDSNMGYNDHSKHRTAACHTFAVVVEDAWGSRVAGSASAGPASVVERSSERDLRVLLGDHTVTRVAAED